MRCVREAATLPEIIERGVAVPSEIVAVAYDSVDRAAKALEYLHAQEDANQLALDEAAVVVHTEDGEIETSLDERPTVDGFGRGAADVTLREEDGETILSYSADFQVGGRLAQIGSRLVVGATRKIADQFFGRLTGVIDEHAERVEPQTAGIRKELVWVAATAILVAVLVWWLISQ